MKICLALILACLSLAVSADKTTPGRPLWELGLGAVLLQRPDYLGAEEQTLYLLPFPSMIYRGEWLKADDDGIQGLLFDSERLRLDISGGGSLPVNSDNNRAREGMDDLDPAFELGPALTYQLTVDSPHKLTARLSARGLVSVGDSGMRYQGWVLNPELRWEFQQVSTLRWGASLEAMRGSADYHGFFHNVDPEFVTPERPRYEADAGYGGTAVAGFVRWQPRPDWQVYTALTYYHLDNVSFDDGPLFRQKYGIYLSFALSRTLLKSTTLVP